MASDHFRAFERRVTSLSGQLLLDDGSASSVQVLNLSLGGACVELSQAPPLEVPARLEIEAPNLWEPLHVASRVIWVQPLGAHFRAGLVFQIENPQVAGWVLDILTLGAYV
jgi:hypothetical protein